MSLGGPRSPSVVVSAPSLSAAPHHTTIAPALTAHHPLLQLIHQQTTSSTVQGPGTVVGVKTKAPPQILPKPTGQGTKQGVATTHAVHGTPAATPSPATLHTHHHGALLLNQMVPNGAVLVQQQTSSGLQLIVKSGTQPKQGLVITNGAPLQPQTLILQGRTQAHQVVRLVPGQMQLQQVQTSSGPALIAVPAGLPRSTPPPQPTIHHTSPLHKKLKKKKKREEEPRLDLANLIKISATWRSKGIEEEEIVCQNGEVSQGKVVCTKQGSKHHLLTPTLQTTSSHQQQMGGLRVSLGEDGTMVVHQPDQTAGVSAGVAAAAQTQLAQLIANHGGHIVQGGMRGASEVVVRGRGSSVLVGPQNGLRLVEPSVASLTEHNRLYLSTPAANTAAPPPPTLIDQNRLQILTGVPTSSGLSLEQQNRIIVSGVGGSAVLAGSQSNPGATSRVIVQNVEQGRVAHQSAQVSLEQNRVIVQNIPLEQQNKLFLSTADSRLHIVSDSVEQQSRSLILSNGLQTEQHNKLHIVSAAGHIVPSNTLSLSEQNRVQIVSSVPSTNINITEKHNLVHIVNNSEQNRVKLEPSSDRIQYVGSDFVARVKEELKEERKDEGTSPIGSPGTVFPNRPNLTVVTKPPPTIVPPPRPRSYDNPFLDSIAQSHPSLVINKSNQPSAHPTRVIKMKKPAKKAALVKPMMAEDRICDKEAAELQHNCAVDSAQQAALRVQTIQLTPNKQQLKQMQTQISTLSGSKTRTSSEQVALQRLITEQQKILLGGKIVTPIQGQNQLNVVSSSSCSNTTTSSVRTTSTRTTDCIQQRPITHANKATSPIHIQVCSSVGSVSGGCGPGSEVSSSQQSVIPTVEPQLQKPVEQPQTLHVPSTLGQQAHSPRHSPLQPVLPPKPLFSLAKRAALIEEQLRADREGALRADTNRPFSSKEDAVKRLLRYHTMNEHVLSEKDLAKADEIFEQTASHLLDKKQQMYYKFSQKILKESMRLHATSELVLLERLISADETSSLDQLKQEAVAAAIEPPPSAPLVNTGNCGKRENEESAADLNKKHCPDDEEINAQVQSAIDSIINLQRGDPLDDSIKPS